MAYIRSQTLRNSINRQPSINRLDRALLQCEAEELAAEYMKNRGKKE